MYRLHVMLLLSILVFAPVSAQDAEPDADAKAETQASEPDASAADEVTDEEIEELLGLDEDYTELEDDFDPTEEVRFEQSIPFPSDI